jgi:hypothetical protein
MRDSVSFIPFLRPFFDVHRRLARPTEEHRPHARLAARPHVACAATYEFVERRYGLTRSDEAEFNTLLDRVVSLPAVLSWPRVEDLAKRDE